jgi:hypothetical protein
MQERSFLISPIIENPFLSSTKHLWLLAPPLGTLLAHTISKLKENITECRSDFELGRSIFVKVLVTISVNT